jgi:hypothetical protein
MSTLIKLSVPGLPSYGIDPSTGPAGSKDIIRLNCPALEQDIFYSLRTGGPSVNTSLSLVVPDIPGVTNSLLPSDEPTIFISGSISAPAYSFSLGDPESHIELPPPEISGSLSIFPLGAFLLDSDLSVEFGLGFSGFLESPALGLFPVSLQTSVTPSFFIDSSLIAPGLDGFVFSRSVSVSLVQLLEDALPSPGLSDFQIVSSSILFPRQTIAVVIPGPSLTPGPDLSLYLAAAEILELSLPAAAPSAFSIDSAFMVRIMVPLDRSIPVPVSVFPSPKAATSIIPGFDVPLGISGLPWPAQITLDASAGVVVHMNASVSAPVDAFSVPIAFFVVTPTLPVSLSMASPLGSMSPLLVDWQRGEGVEFVASILAPGDCLSGITPALFVGDVFVWSADLGWSGDPVLWITDIDVGPTGQEYIPFPTSALFDFPVFLSSHEQGVGSAAGWSMVSPFFQGPTSIIVSGTVYETAFFSVRLLVDGYFSKYD